MLIVSTPFRRALACASLCAVAAALAGCATVTRGSHTDFKVASTPDGAAVKTSNGFSCPTTPCTFRMPRKHSFDVTITLAGYKPATRHVVSKVAGGGAAGFIGNGIVGGVIGAGIDATSGAMDDLYPNPPDGRPGARRSGAERRFRRRPGGGQDAMTRLIHNLRPILVCAALAASALTLCACASAARAEQMVAGPGAVRTLSPGDPGHHQVRIAAVEGGSKTNPLWESEVGDAEFKEALVRSLTAAGYLAEDPAAASMELTANLYKLDKPLLGLDMSVTSTVRYTVMKRPDPKPIYDDNVAATGTGTVGEALIGVERLRVAEEKSIRANIESFLQRLQAALNGQANPPAK